MDAEQQVRLNFLEEALECCDRIESSLLGISTSIAEPSKLDLALRSSHSIKGGASLMGYRELSQSAHRLEDFLKIVRVRHASKVLASNVETLLLQSVDQLRELTHSYQNRSAVDPSWVDQNLSPIYSELHQVLGELNEEDENALFQQEEDVDPALQMFEENVDQLIDEFEDRLHRSAPQTVAPALLETIDALLPFGYMAELDAFIELCHDIQIQTYQTSSQDIQNLAAQALKMLRRSHGLVVRRSLDRLPHQLKDWQSKTTSLPAEKISTKSIETEEIETDSEIDPFDEYEPLDTFDLGDLQTEFSKIPQSLSADTEVASPTSPNHEQTFAELELDAFINPETEIEQELDPFSDVELTTHELETLQHVFKQPFDQDVSSNEKLSIDASDVVSSSESESELQVLGRNIKVSADQLYQFNTLFSRLVLERNSLLAQVEQLKADSNLMRRRISKLSKSNAQLRKWYDRASMEGVISSRQPQNIEGNRNLSSTARSFTTEFDALEMDQYSDLHVISQDQIETLVQIQEVTLDIDTGIRSIERVAKELAQTTQLMQKNVTKVQMVTFENLIKRFPRVVRDLSQRSNKSVQLVIEGNFTLIDRAVMDVLSDALLQLLHNAFDHGIEAPESRRSQGKSPQGIITLKAENRSNETIITLQDDGAGIQTQKIRDRLLQLGIDEAEVSQLSHPDLFNFIFDPGFSTASEVTEVSGRGVGMDLVKTNLAEVRGEISVQSVEGQGTIFTLKVPYSLSIIKVVLVEKAGVVFALPVDSVREINQAIPQTEASYYEWNNLNLPYISLDQYLRYSRPGQRFEMSGNPIINRESIIVAGDTQQLGAFILDRFWGEQEVTIQPISKALPLPPGFVGSLTMGDGRVVPLVDPVQLLEWCLSQESIEYQPSQELIQTQQESTILIVDDSINVRKLLTLSLEKAGFRVEQAKDGQDAVDRLLTGLKVNAIICDIEMPRLDGYGFLEEIKENPDFQYLPIVMLTSRSHDKHRKLALNLGASDYFSKPYDEGQLMARLNELITAT